jgi:hypothetical protein
VSVDTSLASPTSTARSWKQLKAQLLNQMHAGREIEADTIRAEIASQSAKPRTAADALADVNRYKAMLSVPAVLASKWWTEDVTSKLIAATTELKALRRTGGAL